MGLSDVNEWIYGCTRCGTCKNVINLFVPACPAGEKYQLESYFPSGRQFIVRGMFEGKLTLEDDELRKRIEACTACLSCQQQCAVYHHEHIFEMVRAFRTEAVTQGFINPAYIGMVDNLKKEDNVFGKPKAERGEWARGLKVKNAIQEKVDVLYHTGCMLSFDPELWEIPKSLIHLMRAAGVNVGIMGKEETCCGGRAYEIGYVGEFTKYAENCLEAFNGLGVKKWSPLAPMATARSNPFIRRSILKWDSRCYIKQSILISSSRRAGFSSPKIFP
jgi:Fe-S oxidoreductase